MADKTFNRGDTVYAIDGQQGEYLMAYEDAHLVLPHFREDGEPWDGEPWPGGPAVWQEAFTKPPVPVVHEDVAAARVELDELAKKVREAEQQLRTMREERTQLQRDQSAVRARLQEHEALRNIDAFLAGSITHFVVDVDYVPAIQTAQETMEHRDGYRKSIRLLGLFGDEERAAVRWRVTTYGDGSGLMNEVIPCLSLQEAQDRARALLIGRTLPSIRSGRLSAYYGGRALELAAALGVQVPDDVAAKVAADRKEIAAKGLENARREAERHAESLHKAEAEARAAGLLPVAEAPAT